MVKARALEHHTRSTMMLEVCKMLTISTGHISALTAQLLREYCDTGRTTNSGLPITYEKGEYGWFIYVGSIEDHPDETPHENCPDDLKGLIAFTRTHGCDWLCLDSDGLEVPMVPTYDW